MRCPASSRSPWIRWRSMARASTPSSSLNRGITTLTSMVRAGSPGETAHGTGAAPREEAGRLRAPPFRFPAPRVMLVGLEEQAVVRSEAPPTIVSGEDSERARAATVALLRRARRIVLTSHERTDADGAGSALGLVLALRGVGLDARAAFP